MADFTLSTASTTARTLGLGEDGIILQTGSLVATNGAAVTAGSQSNLVVFGILGTTISDAVVASEGAASHSVLIGSTGQVFASGSAFDMDLSGFLEIENAGLLTGQVGVLELGETDGSVFFRLTNSGTVSSSSSDAISVRGGTGGSDIVNSGDILSAGDAINLLGTSGISTLNNVGRIVATDVAYLGSSSTDIVNNSGIIAGTVNLGTGTNRLFNSGTIDGDIITGADADTVNLTGGTVAGDVTTDMGNDVLNLRGAQVSGIIGGGIGNDTYKVSQDNLDLVEGNFGGTDLVQSWADSFTLALNFENLTLMGSASEGYGNTRANIITGNARANLVAGGLGNDSVAGGDGNDSVSGDGGDDNLQGDFGRDLVEGGTGNDVLFGGSDDDVLDGGTGNDRMFGGGGGDEMLGGKGADSFVFLINSDSEDATGLDLVSDFVSGTDTLDFLSLDANLSEAGKQQVKFIGIDKFSDLGQIRFEVVDGVTRVEVNNTGDDAADVVVLLQGVHTLTLADLLLEVFEA